MWRQRLGLAIQSWMVSMADAVVWWSMALLNFWAGVMIQSAADTPE